MNSSTFSSRLGVRLSVTFGLLIGMYFFSGLVLDFVVMRRTTKTNYTQSTTSKTKHMQLNHKPKELDLVFVGSSRTEYHISQKEFSDHGFLVYNLGVSGAKLEAYQHVVHEALSAQPRAFVLSLSVQTLYKHDWECQSGLNRFSLKNLWASNPDFGVKFNAFLCFLKGTNKIRLYSDGLSGQVSAMYQRFDQKTLKTKTKTSNTTLPFSDEECKVIKMSGDEKGRRYKCTNGDAILVGQKLDPQKAAKDRSLENLNMSKIRYLNQIAKLAKDSDIQFILVLEPTFLTKYDYNLSEIKRNLGSHIIDNTAIYRTQNDLWFDHGHLNLSGKGNYSSHLHQQIKAQLSTE